MHPPTPLTFLTRQMPLVGFGLWKVNDACADQVYAAIKAGYRLFDGACDYGNEKECGEGVARAIKDGLVKREDLFIVSKLWNSFHERVSRADWEIKERRENPYTTLTTLLWPFFSSSFTSPLPRLLRLASRPGTSWTDLQEAAPGLGPRVL